MKYLLLPLLASFCVFAVEAKDNLVPNSSFEILGGNGTLLDWRAGSPPYSLSEESPRTGNRCLKFVNKDPKLYRLASIPVLLKPGQSYKFSAWVRCQDMKGKGGGATVCVEWMDKDGKFLGGSYPKGITGSKKEWTEVKGLTAKIPPEAANSHIVCYARKGFTGTAWFDDVSLARYVPPLIGAVVTDAYRNQSDGGAVTVFGALNLDSRGLKAEQVAVSITVSDSRETVVIPTFSVPVADEVARGTIDSSPLPPGTYTILLKVVAGEEKGEKKCSLIRIDSFAKRKAYIDTHGRLIFGGKPFFPLGMYFGGVKKSDMDIYADSPFNCIMPYSGASDEMLDYAYARGVHCIYSVKDFYAGRGGLKTEKEAEAKIRRVVAEKINHPGVIAWYINDEMPLSMLPQLTAHRDLLEEIDPGRPTWVVLYQYSQVRSYLPTFDVIGTDPYPIPHRPISHAYRYAKTTTDACFGTRANWMVPQVFNWASYRKGEEKKKYRAPSLGEMKNMTWQCVAGGATGLVYYSWSDLWRMNKTVENGGRALVAEPFEERWGEVKLMGAEVKRLIPILLSVETPLPVATEGENVVQRLFAKDGFTYVLAVNTSRESSEAILSSPAEVRLLGNELGSAAPASGRQFKLSFAPLESKFLKLGKL